MRTYTGMLVDTIKGTTVTLSLTIIGPDTLPDPMAAMVKRHTFITAGTLLLACTVTAVPATHSAPPTADARECMILTDRYLSNKRDILLHLIWHRDHGASKAEMRAKVRTLPTLGRGDASLHEEILLLVYSEPLKSEQAIIDLWDRTIAPVMREDAQRSCPGR